MPTKEPCKARRTSKNAAAARPHVVLGTFASNEEEACAKWVACDLAKVLVRPEELAHDAPAQRVSLPGAATAQEADVCVPPSLASGLRAREQRMLFEHPPLLSAGHAHAARDDDGGELAVLGECRCRCRADEGRRGDGVP